MKPDATDVLVIAGMVMVGAGLWMIYSPAALIVVGAFMVYLGLPKGVK